MSSRTVRFIVSAYLLFLFYAKQLFAFTGRSVKRRCHVLLIIILLLPSYNGVFKTIRIVAVAALPAKLPVVYITVTMAEDAVL